jgi:hypothetical protein
MRRSGSERLPAFDVASRAKAQSLKTVLLDTDDLGEAEQVVSANFGQIRMAAYHSDTTRRARIVRSFVGSTSMDAADFGYTFSYTWLRRKRYCWLGSIPAQ